MTGDLAYYATALGKINMSGSWCTWCNLNAKEWSQIDHNKGVLWVRTAMDEVRESIYNGELSNDVNSRRGCVDVPLFDDVEINQFIFPVLHAEIGIGNYLLNLFFEWVDFKIEQVTEEEMKLKNDFEFIVSELEVIEKRMEDWTVHYGYELNTLKVEVSRCTKYRVSRYPETNVFMLSLNESERWYNIRANNALGYS